MHILEVRENGSKDIHRLFNTSKRAFVDPSLSTVVDPNFSNLWPPLVWGRGKDFRQSCAWSNWSSLDHFECGWTRFANQWNALAFSNLTRKDCLRSFIDEISRRRWWICFVEKKPLWQVVQFSDHRAWQFSNKGELIGDHSLLFSKWSKCPRIIKFLFLWNH